MKKLLARVYKAALVLLTAVYWFFLFLLTAAVVMLLWGCGDTINIYAPYDAGPSVSDEGVLDGPAVDIGVDGGCDTARLPLPGAEYLVLNPGDSHNCDEMLAVHVWIDSVSLSSCSATYSIRGLNRRDGDVAACGENATTRALAVSTWPEVSLQCTYPTMAGPNGLVIDFTCTMTVQSETRMLLTCTESAVYDSNVFPPEPCAVQLYR